MTENEYLKLREKLPALRRMRVKSEFGMIPKSVTILCQLLDKATSPVERRLLYPLLISEGSMADNDALYLSLLRRELKDFPEDPLVLSGFAYRLAIITPNSKREALDAAFHAVDLAIKGNRLVKHCATNLARIALLLDDYEALNRALALLVSDADNIRAEDTGYEFDLISKIDSERCDKNLLIRFQALQQQQIH